MDACVLEIPELHRAPEGWGEGGGGEGGVWEIAGRLLGSNACLHGRDDYTGSNRWPSSIAASRASTYREEAGREANAFGAHNTPLVRTTPL